LGNDGTEKEFVRTPTKSKQRIKISEENVVRGSVEGEEVGISIKPVR